MTDTSLLKREIAELDIQIAEQLEFLRKQRLLLRDLRQIRELKLNLLNKLEQGSN